jgi:hypothetical protein
MSTKTTFKRIALVAVAALGLGVLTSVAPASAAVSTARVVKVGSTLGATATVNGAYVGVAITVPVAITTTTATTEAETITVTTTATSVPAGSAVALGAAAAGKYGITAATAAGDFSDTAASAKWTATAAAGVWTGIWSAGTIPAQTDGAIGNLSLTADKAGKYVFNVAITSTTGTGTNTNATVTINVSDLYATTADGLSGGNTSNITANAVAGPGNSVVIQAVGGSADRLLTVSGPGAVIQAAGSSVTVSSDKLSGVVAATASATSNRTVTISTPTVGTITVSLFNESQTGIYSATADATGTITVNAAAIAGGVDAAKSTSVLKAGATWAAGTSATTDDEVVVSRTASTTVRASVKVDLVAAAGTITSTTAVTVATTKGTIVLNDQNDSTTTPIATGRSVSSTFASTGSTFYVSVLSDGESGVGTITVTAGTYTATETVAIDVDDDET